MRDVIHSPFGDLSVYMFQFDKLRLNASSREDPFVYQGISFHYLEVNATLQENGLWCLGPLSLQGRQSGRWIRLGAKERKAIRVVLGDVLNYWWNNEDEDSSLYKLLKEERTDHALKIEEAQKEIEENRERLIKIDTQINILTPLKVSAHGALDDLLGN